MKKLTAEQILSTLNLSEQFPSIIWYTQVDNSNGRQGITVQGQKNASQEQIGTCVKTIFPNTKFVEFKTSDHVFSMVFDGREIGSLHMTVDKEKTPAPTEVPGEIIQSNYTTESEVVANA